VPLIILYIVGFELLSRCPIPDDFIKGEKKGMGMVAGIPPTLVVLMVLVDILRTSGFLVGRGSITVLLEMWI